MSSVLLDTTVASLIHPRRAGSSVRAAYEPHMRGMILAVSFQTVAELWAWAEENRWGTTQRTGLEHFLSRFVVVPYSTELAQTWAKVMTAARRKGRRMEAGDAWIAATAVLYEAPLLTHDVDFVGLDIDGLDVVCHA
ncbi:MAG: PIN domain-containing protein [Polyangiaceae bacterium]|nr:PIN domain-containing protein [Polyangiaceae bacterium]